MVFSGKAGGAGGDGPVSLSKLVCSAQYVALRCCVRVVSILLLLVVCLTLCIVCLCLSLSLTHALVRRFVNNDASSQLSIRDGKCVFGSSGEPLISTQVLFVVD